jgi:hypothetical protein
MTGDFSLFFDGFRLKWNSQSSQCNALTISLTLLHGNGGVEPEIQEPVSMMMPRTSSS